MDQITQGDVVAWSSQANGGTTRKVGQVVAVIPAGAAGAARVRREVNERVTAGTHRSAFGGGSARGHESYLVEVVTGGPAAKKALYWPVVSRLER